MIALILVGVVAIRLGAQGFSQTGIPLGAESTLSGTAGRVVGVLCILIGLAAFCGAGLIWMGRSARGP